MKTHIITGNGLFARITEFADRELNKGDEGLQNMLTAIELMTNITILLTDKKEPTPELDNILHDGSETPSSINSLLRFTGMFFAGFSKWGLFEYHGSSMEHQCKVCGRCGRLYVEIQHKADCMTGELFVLLT
jgi:hypothetical protein